MSNFNDEQLPLDSVLKRRLSFGALVGYLAFHQEGSCPIGAEGLACCSMHRLEGLHLAHKMLEGFLETEDMASASLQSLVNSLSAMLDAGVTEKALADFETNAFAALKRAYQMMEPPIVAKLVKSQFLGATQLPTTQQPQIPETQSPPQTFYTQAAVTCMDAASIEDISQFSALPAVLPASSQLAPPIRNIPFEVYGMIMKAGDRTEDIFDEPDETIERSMDGYLGRLKLRMDEVQKGLARILESVKLPESKLSEPSTLFSISTNPVNWERYQKFERFSLDLTAELSSIHDAITHNQPSSGNGWNDYKVFAKYIKWLQDYDDVRSEVRQLKSNLGNSQPKPEPVEKATIEKTTAPLPANVNLHPVPAEAPVNKEKKRLKFDDEETEEDGKETMTSKVADKRKSMLLPNGTAKKLQWNEHEGENAHPNSSSQDAPLRIAKPPKSAILPSSSQVSIVEAPKPRPDTSKQASRQVSKPASPPPEQPLIPCSSVTPAIISTTAPTIQKQKGRRPFSEQETRNLTEGLRRFGRKWSIILATYDFNDRTQTDLKDKARNLEKAGLIVLPPSR